MNSTILEAEEHVLSTLEKDGSRRWLRPKLSQGRLLTWRRIVAYLLIAIFTILPFLRISGRPVILLDVMRREFTLFGYTFLPTDSLLLAIFAVGSLISIFLLTAFLGRVWCGWACPQTVYMEFVYRPIERLFDGTVGRGGQPKSNRSHTVARWVFRYLVYTLVSFYLANTFLAYFLGTDTLWAWVQQSPLSHPVPFMIVAFVTVAMMFDFCFFREQMCILACPYGRFQSVLLDRNSLVVSYDQKRGEPRGKTRKGTPHVSVALPVLKESPSLGSNNASDLPGSQSVLASTVKTPAAGQSGAGQSGDCVDCGLCVVTCPTGIDIRNGLQMECINCTQCIDACNAVMEKVGRAPNLIRYSSQAADQGEPWSLLRARVIVYPLILMVLGTAFLTLLVNKNAFDAVILRERGNPYTRLDDGLIRNVVKLKLTNRQRDPMSFQLVDTGRPEIQIRVVETDFELPAQESREFHMEVDVPPTAFKNGRLELPLVVENQNQQQTRTLLRLVGPLSQ